MKKTFELVNIGGKHFIKRRVREIGGWLLRTRQGR